MTSASVIEFAVAGVPVGQPRPRAQLVRRAASSFVHMYTPDAKIRPWKQAVAAGFAPHQPATTWTGPVRVSVQAFFPRPQRLLRKTSPDGAIWMPGKPDLDNVLKAIKDALTWSSGRGLWDDDAQVVAYGPCGKWYVARGCQPGVRVRCELIEEVAGE